MHDPDCGVGRVKDYAEVSIAIFGFLTLLGGIIRILIKYNWKLQQQSDKAKAETITVQMKKFEYIVNEHKLMLRTHAEKIHKFEDSIVDFSRRLDLNRSSAEAVLDGLNKFIKSTEDRFKRLEDDFGKVIIKTKGAKYEQRTK